MLKTTHALLLSIPLAMAPFSRTLPQCCQPRGPSNARCGEEAGIDRDAVPPALPAESAPGAAAKSSDSQKSGPKPQTPASTKSEAAFLKPYFSLWRALADDSVRGVADARKDLIASLGAMLRTTPPGLSARDRDRRNKILAGALREAERLDPSAVTKARLGFGSLSSELASFVENNPQDGDAYILYCDMAKKRWLQDAAVVLNPYYGRSMLRCGRVTHEPKKPQGKAQPKAEAKPKEKTAADPHKGGHEHR